MMWLKAFNVFCIRFLIGLTFVSFILGFWNTTLYGVLALGFNLAVYIYEVSREG